MLVVVVHFTVFLKVAGNPYYIFKNCIRLFCDTENLKSEDHNQTFTKYLLNVP